MDKKINIGLNLASFEISERRGGPSTYLFYLGNGLENIGVRDVIIKSLIENKLNKTGIKTNGENVIYSFLKGSIMKHFPSLFSELMFRKLEKNIIKIRNSFDKQLTELASNFEVKFIHFHSVVDILSASNIVKPDIIKILTSHTPEAPHLEYVKNLENYLIKHNLETTSIDKICRKTNTYMQAIDKAAFSEADYLMFPCEESMEPYYLTWSDFEKIINNKNIFFVPTGTTGLTIKENPYEIRKRCGIPSEAFVVSYVGRHNTVKGYDILCKAAEIVWRKNPHIYFLIAGREEPLKGINDTRWMEVGWTNSPGDIVSASDVFVLPNRRTFFDLVLLETMSIGKPVIASYTGGNKYVAKQTEGIITFQPVDEESLAKVILELSVLKKDDLQKLGEKNLILYRDFYTVEAFAKRYREAVGKLFFGE